MREYQIFRKDSAYTYTNVGAYKGKNPDDAIEKMAVRGDVHDPHWKKQYIAIPCSTFIHRKIKNT